MATESKLIPPPSLKPVGEHEATSIPLVDRLVWKVGRSAKNEIVIRDDRVSRSHAMIQRSGELSYILIDLGSRNGAYVNGRRVSVPVELNDGDRITLCSHEFVFEHAIVDDPEDEKKVEEITGEQTHLFYSLRQTTVLVVDIRDFTGLSQRLEEHILARTIGTWIDKCGSILEFHESWCQKYIGDAIMAVWVQAEGPDKGNNSLLSIRALHKIVEVTQALQSQFELPERIRIGAGINTGLASVGNLGSDAAADYTALGDCVNLAFRLESATKQLNVDSLVGEETYAEIEAASADLSFFEKHTATLKGYSKPSTCYGLSFDKLKDLAASMDRGESELTEG